MPFSRPAVYEHDRTWAWKAVIRALIIIFDIIGIGLIGWALGKSLKTPYNANYSYSYYYDEDTWEIPWNLITFALSFIWCLTNLCILLARSKWIHPGANVGCDLILWLSFIVTALLSTAAAASDLVSYYEDDYYGYSSYSYPGETYHYPNGTVSEIRPPCPGFDTCDQENALLRERRNRGMVIAVASAFSWLMVLLHFALFISACRYTHQRRRGSYADRKMQTKAAEIEEKVIRRLEAEGRLKTPPGTAAGMASARGAGEQQATMQPPQIHIDPGSPAGGAGEDQGSMIPAPLYQEERRQGGGEKDRITTVRDV